jgi:hypothetical protein
MLLNSRWKTQRIIHRYKGAFQIHEEISLSALCGRSSSRPWLRSLNNFIFVCFHVMPGGDLLSIKGKANERRVAF